MTCILISHKLSDVEYVADRITVIRDGVVIETLTEGVDDCSEAHIIKGMVGRELTDRFPRREPHIGDVSMEVRNWTVYHPIYEGRKVCDDVNLTLRKGEVVGISGLMGAGRTELAMSIFGQSYGTDISGQIFINGKEVHLRRVKDAIRNGLAYVTEDRKGNGLIVKATIRENTTLARMEKISRHGVLDKDLEIKAANEYKEKLHLKCSGVEQLVDNLSGATSRRSF